MQASIYKILPFDAASGTTIRFAWNGNQAFKNRCIIRKNETNELVYDNTIDSYALEHPIDPGRLLLPLENGTKYNAYITVFDKNQIESELPSLGTVFICLKTPDFHFLSMEQTISASSHTFSLSYSQENGELLNSWSIHIYSRDHILLSSSGISYNTDELSHTFSGFSNQTEYCVRALGQTVSGMELDTGFINISVHYDIFNVFSMLELVNLKKSGAIYLKSNIITAKGELEKEPGIYIDDEFLDLRDNRVTFREGFLFEDDYSFYAGFYGAAPNRELIYFSANDPEEFHAAATYRIGKLGSDQLQGCFELKVISGGIASVYYSNKLSPVSPSELIGLMIYRQNGRYVIKAARLGGDS